MLLVLGRIKMTNGILMLSDTQWSGCYFELTDLERRKVFVVEMISSATSNFGAYLFASSIKRRDTMCSLLGIPTALPNTVVSY